MKQEEITPRQLINGINNIPSEVALITSDKSENPLKKVVYDLFSRDLTLYVRDEQVHTLALGTYEEFITSCKNMAEVYNKVKVEAKIK